MGCTRLIETLEPRRLACLPHDSAAEAPVDGLERAAAAGTLSWISRASMPQKREEGAAAVVNGRLYALGGFYDYTFNATARIDVYDPATNVWVQKRNIPEALTHSAAVVVGSEIWLFGGYVGRNPGPATRHVWKYQTANNTWSAGPDMPAARGAGAATKIGNTIFYVGGRNGDRTAEIADTWALDLATLTWSTRPPMPNPRNHIAAAEINGRLYAIGGQHNEASQAIEQSTVDRFDPATNQWTAVASLPVAVSHNTASTYSYNNHLIVVGGETAHNLSTADVWTYDPLRNNWRDAGDLPAARRATQTGIINGRLYVAGGSIVGSQKTDVWSSNPISQWAPLPPLPAPSIAAPIDLRWLDDPYSVMVAQP